MNASPTQLEGTLLSHITAVLTLNKHNPNGINTLNKI